MNLEVNSSFQSPEPNKSADRLSAIIDLTLERSDNPYAFPYVFGDMLKESKCLDIETVLSFRANFEDPVFREKINDKLKRAFDGSGESIDPSTLIREINSTAFYALLRDTRDLIIDSIRLEDISALRTAIDSAWKNGRILCEEFKIVDEEKGYRFTFEDFKESNFRLSSADIDLGGSFGMGAGRELCDLRNLIEIGEFYSELFASYPTPDTEQFNADVSKFGAKGANLLKLKRASEEMSDFLKKYNVSFNIPDFTLLPIDSTELELHTAYHWIGDREIIVRSSGRYSEDGNSLGAGVHESILLPHNPSLAQFLKAVELVKDSINSEVAVIHRKRLGIDHEEMGVIVQEFIHSGEARGYVNTFRPGMSSVLEINFQERYFFPLGEEDTHGIKDSEFTPVLLYRDLLIPEMLHSSGIDMSGVFVVPLDMTRYADFYAIHKLAKVSLILERYFGNPRQLEFVLSPDEEISIVQSRPLPKGWGDSPPVTFPEDPPLWRSGSVGVIDEVLPILEDDSNNYTKKGLLILTSGYLASTQLDWLEKVLPKEGAVLLLRQSEMMRGHIESRCLERGVTILTGATPHWLMNAHSWSDWERLGDAFGFDAERVARHQGYPAVLAPTHKLSKLRVISTGLEGRCYLVDDSSDRPAL